MQPIKVIC